MRHSLLPVMLLTGMAVMGVTACGQVRAGAGKSDIKTTQEMWPVNGFTSQHDPLSVRVLLLEDNIRSAIVVIDQTSISDASIASAKSILKSVANVEPENTLVIATHMFSAPHVFGGPPTGGPGSAGTGGQNGAGPRELERGPVGGGPGGPPPADPGTAMFSKALDTATEAAAVDARKTLQSVKIGFGVGTTDITVNRDMPTPRGWWLGGDAAGFTDRALPVARIDKMDGKPLAVLMNEAVQSSIMDQSRGAGGGKVVTADLAGTARKYIEEHFGNGTVAFFLIGAAGDQAPVLQGTRYVLRPDGTTTREDLHDAGFTLVDLIGERLGTEAVEAAEKIQPMPKAGIQILRRELEVDSQGQAKGLPTEPVTSYIYTAGPKMKVPVILMKIGDIVMVGLQPELAASIGAKMKAGSPFPNTMVVTLVDGGAKYMPDAASYPRFTYEARNSRFAQGSAEIVAAGVIDLLKSLKASSSGAR